MTNPAGTPDDDLARSLAASEAAALVYLTQRHGQGLFDFADRLLLDSDAALDVVESALRRAQAEAVSRPADLEVRAWLFGLLREEALASLRSHNRVDLLADAMETPPVENERFFHTAYSDENNLAVWVWEAARSLRPRDYSLLDLSLRRQFTPQDIAQIASLSRSTIYATLGRLRGALEDSFATGALYATGGDACSDLKELIGTEAELQPALRREITQHAETCSTCRNTLGALPLAADIFAALLDVDPPPALAQRVAALSPDESSSAGLTDQTQLPFAEAVGASSDDGQREDVVTAAPSASVGPEAADEPASVAPAATELEADTAASATGPPTVEPDVEPASEINEPAAGPRPARRIPVVPGRRVRDRLFEPSERIRFEGGEAAPPPRRPFAFSSWFGDPDRKRRIGLFALLAGLTLLAAYGGVAIGDSIQGGGGSPDALPIVATVGGRARLVACGSGPINVDQGSRVTVSFDSSSLAGYSISSANIRAVSANAAPQLVVAKPQQGLNILVDALPAAGPGPRTDEYRLDVTLDKGNDRIASECTVLVRVPVAATAAAPATGTGTPPVRTTTPGATGTPAATGTVLAPTGTPGPATPTATRVP